MYGPYIQINILASSSPAPAIKDMYDFSGDSILLCLSSEHYDAEEYIRDMDEFMQEKDV